MQQPTANGCVRNGDTAVDDTSNGATEANGHQMSSAFNGDSPTTVSMDKINQDIIRLIGQHLRTVGLK